MNIGVIFHSKAQLHDGGFFSNWALWILNPLRSEPMRIDFSEEGPWGFVQKVNLIYRWTRHCVCHKYIMNGRYTFSNIQINSPWEITPHPNA